MTNDEIQIAIDWAAAEGWNPGLNDAPCFYQTDPKGFFLGLLDDKPIGCISVVSYQGTFGFLGFYIVHPEYRGQGYGIQIWNRGMEYLRHNNIGLDGVIDQQMNYKKSGFKLAYRNIRYEGTANHYSVDDKFIRPVREVEFTKLVAYDTKFFPVEREVFLNCWFNMPDSHTLVYVEDGIKGYGTIRKCLHGYKIGPLFSDNEKIAEQLLNALSSKVEIVSPIFLDVPEVNPEAVVLAQKHSMRKVFETARMYTKEEPQIKLDGIFGVTTFELG
ncbi:MAG: GNAT family N-acetyltransferase [bacterium]